MRRCDLYDDIRRGRECWKGMRHSRGGVSPAETQGAFKERVARMAENRGRLSQESK